MCDIRGGSQGESFGIFASRVEFHFTKSIRSLKTQIAAVENPQCMLYKVLNIQILLQLSGTGRC